VDRPGNESAPAAALQNATEAAREEVDPAPAGGPMVEVEGDQIRLSLTSVTLAVVIFAVLIALLGVFALGRRAGDAGGFARGFEAGRASYAADAMSEIEAARQQPPATELVGSLLTEPIQDQPVPTPSSSVEETQPAAVSAAPETPWISGYTYIVAQEFSAGRRDDAVKAKAFLVERGIDTALIELSTGSMQLITTQGFDRDDPAQRRLADEFLARVHAAGAAFFARRGGYKLEGYFKKLKGDTW